MEKRVIGFVLGLFVLMVGRAGEIRLPDVLLK
jgi:hypothetical protein